MLFDDFLDDREAESGAALPRRHIGFGNGVARLGKADPVSIDANDNLAERARRHGGTCSTTSLPSGGTALRWQVPLRDAAPTRDVTRGPVAEPDSGADDGPIVLGH